MRGDATRGRGLGCKFFHLWNCHAVAVDGYCDEWPSQWMTVMVDAHLTDVPSLAFSCVGLYRASTAFMMSNSTPEATGSFPLGPIQPFNEA